MSEDRQNDDRRDDGPVFSAEQARQGEIILRTRPGRIIFIAGLVGIVILAIVASFETGWLGLWNRHRRQLQLLWVCRICLMIELPFLFIPISIPAPVGLAPQQTNHASALINVALAAE
ncbi:hypothetical protein [Mesorhizobium neociceri]|uniref:hypothetical protein n=1 Tax=Mesorhizobium neociceri TaxID=1307853 RepID=UPI001F36536C|nr:hypothetical protein [Mesorhizobium neociceri]